MAQQGLPPIPNQPVSNAHEWREWFFRLWESLGGTEGQIYYNDLNFTGSNITSIQTRAHNTLQGLQGGNVGGTEYYHLDASDYNKIATPNYGAFHDTTTQNAAVINTAYGVTFNTTDLSTTVTIGSPTSRVINSVAGIYNFQFSAQLHKTNASVGFIYIWARVNGTDIADSAGKIHVNGSQAETIASWNYVLSMNANDYFELMWSTNDINCQLLAAVATAPVPAIPSVILTVTQVA
jgi:hypothetical protein